ncbi:MAG TPA: thioesterase family protein [Anaerolineales bacterium]|nr:thioesterase family protein [Anaerolineales bacterium]
MIEPYRFSTELRVRFNETDAQGHVNFAWYLNYFDIALLAYLQTLGCAYTQMLEDGLDMLYIDAHAAYHAPAYYDDLLRIHCRIGRIGSTSMRFDFQIFNPSAGRLVAKGEITVVFARRNTYEKLRVPDAIRQAVSAYEGVVLDN